MSRTKEIQIFESIKQKLTTDDGSLLYAGNLLQRACQQFPTNIALIEPTKTITYKELYFRSLLVGKKLKEAGVQPGDRVLLYFENSAAFYVAYFAIWQLGAVVCPLNIFLHAKELAHIITDAAPSLIFSSSTLQSNLEDLVTDGLLATLPPILNEQIIDWDAAVPSDIAAAFPDMTPVTRNTDQLCVLMYSSGTTGVPKGIMLSSKNILTNTMQSYARFTLNGQTDKERFFSVLPLFHVFAQHVCLWLPIMTGSSIIIVAKIDRKLILEGLEKKPTLFFGFPALYGLLCLMKTAPLDSIKMFVSGADMLPDKIRAGFAMIYGRKICSGYGLSEASPVVGVNHENDEEPTTVIGYPLVGIDCEVRDDSEQQVERGTIGTLWLRGDNIMMGYYNAPESTATVLKNGWLNTGDLGSIDEQGKLAIRGRSKDLIIHKGFNIYPAEIENILMRHPAVFKAAVIGQPEAMSGEVPVAFVAVKKSDSNLEEHLRILCASNLASYKIPRKFICLEDLPMNATGKIDKKQLHL